MRKTNKDGFADAGQVINRAMRVLSPNVITYHEVQLELAAATKLDGPEAVAAYRKAQKMLAVIAASEFFDPHKHRAISQSLRELVKGNAPVAPVTSRKA